MKPGELFFRVPIAFQGVRSLNRFPMHRLFPALFFLLSFSGPVAAEGPVEPLALMPRVGDHTLMYWAEGFPSHTPTAPWRRVVRTGSYAFVLDTETLTIPHFGPIPPGPDYGTAARSEDRAWGSLPPANLSLTVMANGKRYTNIGGAKWSQFGGPRLVDSFRPPHVHPSLHPRNRRCCLQFSSPAPLHC